MASEKRSIIYELLVEAKGGDKAKGDVGALGTGLADLEGLAKKAGLAMVAAFTVKGIADALDQLTKFNIQMETLGLNSEQSATALEGVQDVAFLTGQSMESITHVMAESIELQQVLGRTTADATRTTEAFVKAALAEGKSAEAAATQISNLSFAIESGVVKGKEFIGMLKESNTFQEAAEAALGKTTAQLVEMAKEGEFTARQLTDIVLKMEELGEQKETAATVDGLIQSLKTLGTVLVEGIAQAAGFDAKVGPGGQTGMKIFIDMVQGLAMEIGGLIRLIFNLGQEMVNVAALFANVLTDPLHIMDHWKQYTADVTRDLEDMEAALKSIREGAVKGTNQDPNYTAAGIAQKNADQKARDDQARARADLLTIIAIRKEAEEEYSKWLKEQEKKRAEEKVKAEKKAVADAEKARKERAEQQARYDAARVKSYEQMGKAAEKDVADYLKEFDKKNALAIEKTLEEMNKNLPNIQIAWSDAMLDMAEETGILADAFAGLFSGGITNARDFFAQVLQGFAQMFAQLAAMQAQAGVLKFLRSFGSAFGSGAASASGGVNLDSLQGYWAAKGAAFDRGRVMPFAQGGIVSSPAVFPMASGGVGVMGEAGPEAVMPLRRTSGGRLGVAGAPPNITLVNNLGVKAAARVDKSSHDRMTLVLEAAHLGASIAEGRINRSINTGYGSTAASMAGTYGLRRRV